MNINEFIDVMEFPTETQVKRVIKEFDIMSEDLNMSFMIFEYRLNHNTGIYTLSVEKSDIKRFKKYIDFILWLIKDSGGF